MRFSYPYGSFKSFHTFAEAETIGAEAFIDKPFDREELLAVLGQVLAEK